MFVTTTAVVAVALSVAAYKGERNPPATDKLAIAHYMCLLILLASILWSLR